MQTPTTSLQLNMNLFPKKEPQASVTDTAPELNSGDPLSTIPKNKWEKIWPVLACGSGLLAEGYVQSVRLSQISATPEAHIHRLLGPLEPSWA